MVGSPTRSFWPLSTMRMPLSSVPSGVAKNGLIVPVAMSMAPIQLRRCWLEEM